MEQHNLNDHLKQVKYNAKISLKVTAYFSKSDMSLSKVIKDTVLNSSVAFCCIRCKTIKCSGR